MAGGAFASPWHFSRSLTRETGEPPVALRRRVMLERAAWQLRSGTSVTDAALAAGYDSVEGFSRAFSRAWGHPPSATAPVPDGRGTSRHWLPAPNGIHFHPPLHLYVQQHPKERAGMDVTGHLVHHDVADTTRLLELTAGLDDEAWRRPRLPGLKVLSWDGEESSIAEVLEHLVFTKEVWLASIEGGDVPSRAGDDPRALAARHEAVAPRWLATVRDIDERDAWASSSSTRSVTRPRASSSAASSPTC
jgi:AraC-like DNA-binding protein